MTTAEINADADAAKADETVTGWTGSIFSFGLVTGVANASFIKSFYYSALLSFWTADFSTLALSFKNPLLSAWF